MFRVTQAFNAIKIWVCFLFLVNFFNDVLSDKIEIISWISITFTLLTVIFKQDDDETRLLNKEFKNLENEQETQIFIEKLILLSLEAKHSKHSSVLLNGYISRVQNSSSEESSALILNEEKFSLQEIRNGKFQKKSREMFYEHISELYIEAIKKFPNSNNLRISNSLFMAEFTSKKNLIMEELRYLEGINLPLDMIYIVEGVMEVIKGEENENNAKRKFDLSSSKNSKLLQERVWNQLEILMEKSSIDMIYFWQNLMEDAPNIINLQKFGLKSMNGIERVLKFWNQKENTLKDTAYPHFGFGMFLKDILNMKKEGEEVIRMAMRILEKEDKRRQNFLNLNYSDSLLKIKEACMIVKQSKYDPNLLSILNCNAELGIVLGYVKQELIGLKFTDILFEDSYEKLSFFVKRLKKKNERIMKNCNLALKHKNGLMFVLEFKIKQIFDSEGNTYLIFSNERKKFIREETRILIDNKGHIISHTGSAFSFFGLWHPLLKKNRVKNISQLAKIDLNSLIKLTKQKRETTVELMIWHKKSRGEKEISLQVFDSSFLGKNNFILRFSRNPKKKGNGNTDESHGGGSEYKLVKSVFQDRTVYNWNREKFCFFVNKKAVIEGKFFAKGKKEFLSNLILLRFNVEKYMKKLRVDDKILENAKGERVDYAEGVKTKRLMNGNIMDWYPEMDDFDSFEDEMENEALAKKKLKQMKKKSEILSKKKIDEDKIFVDYNKRKIEQLQDKTELKKIVKKSKLSTLTKCTFSTSVLMIFVYFFIEYTNFNTKIKISENLSYYTDMTYAINIGGADLHDVVARITDVCLLNNGSGKLTNMPGVPFEAVINTDYKYINTSIYSFENLTRTMEQNLEKVTLSDKYLMKYREKDVEVFNGGKGQFFSLSEANRQMRTIGMSFYYKGRDNMVFTAEEFDFLYKNLNGNYRKKYEDFGEFIEKMKEEVVEIYESSGQSHLIFLSICFFIFFFPLFCFFSQKLKKFEKKIESFFLFENRETKRLIKQYENYLKILQMKQFEEYEMNIWSEEEDSDSSDNELERLGKNARSSFKFRTKKVKKKTLNPFFHRKKLLLFLIMGIITIWSFSNEMNQVNIIKNSLELLTSIETVCKVELTSYSVINTMLIEMVGTQDTYMDNSVSYYRHKYVEKLDEINDSSFKDLSLASTEIFNIIIEMSNIIDYFNENKDAKWYLKDNCIEYAYLSNWKRNVRCVFDSLEFELMQRRFTKLFYRTISSVVKDFVLDNLKKNRDESLNQLLLLLLGIVFGAGVITLAAYDEYLKCFACYVPIEMIIRNSKLKEMFSDKI